MSFGVQACVPRSSLRGYEISCHWLWLQAEFIIMRRLLWGWPFVLMLFPGLINMKRYGWFVISLYSVKIIIQICKSPPPQKKKKTERCNFLVERRYFKRYLILCAYVRSTFLWTYLVVYCGSSCWLCNMFVYTTNDILYIVACRLLGQHELSEPKTLLD